MGTTCLSNLHTPSDLRTLTFAQTEQLAKEIRTFLVNTVSQTGGHLSSNLGVVELTLALHRAFDSPRDPIIWDVGHQCYVHKIITGRRDQFSTLRQAGGLSGYPKRSESEHDIFIAGHSSTSISAGYGLVQASLLSGRDNYVVVVIGDGAFTGGMVYEALNNAGRQKAQLIVILNHNDMSIGANVGGISKYLTVIRSSKSYAKIKQRTQRMLGRIPFVGTPLVEWLRKSKSAVKRIFYRHTWFEEMGFHHLGPVDGHNLKKLSIILEHAKEHNGPVLIHVDTVKGKGYPFAEQDPGAYHGVSAFDPQVGQSKSRPLSDFSRNCGAILTKFAALDPTLCAITAAMQEGTGLTAFAKAYPDRFFDVGIAEQHAVTFAAGLATGGMRPVFVVYSTFLQRAYDQVIHDCAIDRQHVVFAIDRAGVVGEDGETHQGVFDVSFLGAIPGMTLYAPAHYQQLEACLERALYRTDGVVAVRYPRGAEQLDYPPFPDSNAAYDCDYQYHQAEGDTLLLTYGRLTREAMLATIECPDLSVLQLIKLLPFSEEVLSILRSYQHIFCFEEGIQSGGIGEKLLVALYARGYRGEFHLQAIHGQFVSAGKTPDVLAKLGLDASAMVHKIRDTKRGTP